MKNIVLVGFMGTGKTAVGKALARRLNREFLELDEIIERRESTSIKEIFERKGEPYFRKLEKEIVEEVSEKHGVIISAGGGAVVDKDNFNNLKKNGIIICLEASPDVILARTKGLNIRPLLNVPHPRRKIIELLNKRAPYYKRADYYIDTDKLSIDEVVSKVIKIVQ